MSARAGALGALSLPVVLRLGALCALVLGLGLRLGWLGRQVLAGDEYHIVGRVLARTPVELLSTFYPVDFNLPHAALTRLLSDLGVPISESLLRAPLVLFGLLTLVVLPAWAARLWGRHAGWALLWLIAISPWLVHFARIVRSYGWIAFLGPATVLSLIEGWRRGGDGYWRLAAALGAAAVWSHLLAAPFVAGGFALLGAAVAADLPRGARSRWREYLGSAGLALACVLAALAPATQSIVFLLGLRFARAPQDWQSWEETGLNLAGTTYSAVACAVGLLALLGFRRALARDRIEGLLLVGPVALQIVALAWLRPSGSDDSLVLSRYLVVALPLLLLAAALGLAALLERWIALAPRSAAAAWTLSPALAAALLFAGPLPAWIGPSRFLHDRDAIDFVRPEPRASKRLIQFVAASPLAGAEVIAFVPGGWSWSQLEDAIGAEPVLGRRLRLFFPVEPHPRLAFRNSPPFTVEGVLASDAEALVLNRAALNPRRNRPAPDAGAALRALSRALGPPLVSTREFLGWDLERARRLQRARERRRARLAE